MNVSDSEEGGTNGGNWTETAAAATGYSAATGWPATWVDGIELRRIEGTVYNREVD